MKKLFVFILLILGLQSAKAQQPVFQERIFMPSPSYAVFTASAVTRQGNILLSGPVTNFSGLDSNYYMLLDPNLNAVWTRRGPKLMRMEHDIRQTSDNGFILAGTIEKGNSYNMLLQKLDANGQIQWTRSYPFVYSFTNNVLPMPDKGYLVGGEFGYRKYFSFMKFDSLGNFKWYKDYTWAPGNGLNKGFSRMALTHSGNIVGLGYTKYPFPTQHIKMMVVNQNGDSVKGSQVVVNGINRIEEVGISIGAVLSQSDGGFFVSGLLDTLLAGPDPLSMGMVVKINSNLQPVWKYVHRSNSVAQRFFVKAVELSDASVMVLAYDYVPRSNQFYLYRFSRTGQIMNLYTFPSTVGTLLESIKTFDVMPDSSFIIGGMSSNNVTGNFAYYVAKVKIPGLAKAVTVTGVKPELTLEGTSLGQSYPNPAAEAAIIPYNLPGGYRKASIIIRDITGREAGNYIIRKNSNSLEVNLSNFRNGLYTYTLVVDEKPVATKKLAVMK